MSLEVRDWTSQVGMLVKGETKPPTSSNCLFVIYVFVSTILAQLLAINRSICPGLPQNIEAMICAACPTSARSVLRTKPFKMKLCHPKRLRRAIKQVTALTLTSKWRPRLGKMRTNPLKFCVDAAHLICPRLNSKPSRRMSTVLDFVKQRLTALTSNLNCVLQPWHSISSRSFPAHRPREGCSYSPARYSKPPIGKAHMDFGP